MTEKLILRMRSTEAKLVDLSKVRVVSLENEGTQPEEPPVDNRTILYLHPFEAVKIDTTKIRVVAVQDTTNGLPG